MDTLIKKKSNRKELQIFLKKYFYIPDQKAFKNFNIIKVILRFSAPPQKNRKFSGDPRAS